MLSRRSFLQGSAASAVAIAASSRPATAFASAVSGAYAHPRFASKVGDLLKDNKVVILAPKVHEPKLYEPMTSRAFFDFAQKQGVTDYYEEFPGALQIPVNDFLDGKTTKKAFIDNFVVLLKKAITEEVPDLSKQNRDNTINAARIVLNHTLDRMKAAGDSGLIVHCCDSRSLNEYIGLTKEDGVQSDIKFLERLKDNDRRVANYIKTTCKGKGLVTYAVAHVGPHMGPSEKRGELPGNIDDALRSPMLNVSNATIWLSEDPQGLAALFANIRETGVFENNDLPGIGIDVPSGVYSPSTGEMVNVKDGPIILKNTSKPAPPPSLLQKIQRIFD